MSAKRRWELGAGLALVVAVVISGAFAVRQWTLNEQLVVAVSASKPLEVAALLRQGADPDHRDRRRNIPVVMLALDSGATLKVLLKAGADPNAKSEYNHAIMDAAGRNHLDIADILLQYGANVDAASSDGTTALYAAVQNGDSPEMVRKLIGAGARLDVRNRKGYTPLRLSKQILLRRKPAYMPRGHLEIWEKRRRWRLEINRILVEAGAPL